MLRLWNVKISSLFFEGRGRPREVGEVEEDWEVARSEERVDVKARLVEDDISLDLDFGLGLLW